jgi:acetylglutamate kinase
MGETPPGPQAQLGNAERAGVLLDALRWLKEAFGRVVVVKYGGNAMVDETLKRAFAEDMVLLHYMGIRTVVVHGGGPQVTSMLSRLGIESTFRAGLRVTTPEMLDIVRMVLVGQVGRELVGLVNEHGPHAVGLSGEDAGLFLAQRTAPVVAGNPVEVGLVGRVVAVDPAAVLDLLQAGRIPVISTVAPDAEGQVLNVNADTAAAALAVALDAVKLVVLTDVEGMYRDWPERSQLIHQIGIASLDSMLPALDSGMRPKMEACRDAVAGGVSRATVIDGRVPHALALEMLSSIPFGTMVVPDAGQG